jgi:hypothetical protein
MSAELKPFTFRDMDVQRPGYQSRRLYELLHSTFGDEEVESRRELERTLHGTFDRRNSHPRLIVARVGLLARSSRWKMVEPVVAAVVSGEYVSLAESGRPDDGFGALAHLVTHPRYGRGGGHGAALTIAFEARVAKAARLRGQRLRLILLESVPGARGFWADQGYRFLPGARYYQPSLAFDQHSGAALQAVHPLTLMVKLIA